MCTNQLMEAVKLNSGNLLPLLSFGTFRIRKNDVILEVMDQALGAGYRSFDTAAVYGNEAAIGLALQELLPKYQLKRNDIFLTTKLSPEHNGKESEISLAVENSLKNLKTDYIDLYLIHWPGIEGKPAHHQDNPKFRKITWQVLISLQQKRLFRDIGVSNYNQRHLEELLGDNHDVIPAVNQMEWHPHHHQPTLKQFCDQKGIVLQAYSPLGSSTSEDLRRDPTVVAIAGKYNCSPAQVLLQWSIQQNVPVVAKARSKNHIAENIIRTHLDSADIQALNELDMQQKYAWNPDVVL